VISRTCRYSLPQIALDGRRDPNLPLAPVGAYINGDYSARMLECVVKIKQVIPLHVGRECTFQPPLSQNRSAGEIASN